jgi:predicted metal-dependent hydrolase
MWNRKTEISIVHNGDELQIALKYSKRKTMALYVYRDARIELRLPELCPVKEVKAFLHARRDWIVSKQAQFQAMPEPLSPSYSDGEQHGYLGKGYPLVLLRGSPVLVEKLGDSIVVRLPDPANPDSVEKALAKWYRQMALIEFPLRLDDCYQSMQHLGIPQPQLKVRKMKARWGSCSSSAQICLNSVLIQKSVEAIDYVITHELCHLVEFSHSAAFHALMTEVMPDWQQREKLLADGIQEADQKSV